MRQIGMTDITDIWKREEEQETEKKLPLTQEDDVIKKIKQIKK